MAQCRGTEFRGLSLTLGEGSVIRSTHAHKARNVPFAVSLVSRRRRFPTCRPHGTQSHSLPTNNKSVPADVVTNATISASGNDPCQTTGDRQNATRLRRRETIDVQGKEKAIDLVDRSWGRGLMISSAVHGLAALAVGNGTSRRPGYFPGGWASTFKTVLVERSSCAGLGLRKTRLAAVATDRQTIDW